MPLYRCWGGSSQQGAGQKEEQEKEVTAGVADVELLPDEGKTISKVTVHPTPSFERDIVAETERITVTPPEGMHFSKVNVSPTPSYEETVTALATNNLVAEPDDGKLFCKITVEPTPSSAKEVTAGSSDKTVYPDSGKLLSKVTVHPTPSEEVEVYPRKTQFFVTPSANKLLSRVTVLPTPLVEKTVDFSYDKRVFNPSDYMYNEGNGIAAIGFSKFTVNAPVTQTINASPNVDSTRVITPDNGKVLAEVDIQPLVHNGIYPSGGGYLSIDPGTTKSLNLGTYHKVKTVNIKGTVPKGYTVEWHGTAIWTNGSPTSAFAAQEITLPKTFQMYYDDFAEPANGGEVYIDFVYRVHKDDVLSGSNFAITVQPWDIMRLRLKDFMNYCQYGDYGHPRFCISCTGKTAKSQYTRTITCSGDRIVKFHAAYSAGSTDAANNWLIPTRILITVPTIVADPDAGYE